MLHFESHSFDPFIYTTQDKYLVMKLLKHKGIITDNRRVLKTCTVEGSEFSVQQKGQNIIIVFIVGTN